MIGDPTFLVAFRTNPEHLPDMAIFHVNDALVDMMDRRLVIARSIPTVRELRARLAAGRSDLEPLVVQLRRERSAAADRPRTLEALDRFLAAADVASVDAIITALYDVISGPAGGKRDWDRFRSLFIPEARLISSGPKRTH